MPENTNQNKGIESGLDVGEPKIKKGIESGCYAAEPETKGRNQIWAQCQKQKEGIESRCDAGEPEIQKEMIEFGRNEKEPESKQRDSI